MFNNRFTNKNDPLLEAVQSAMQEGAMRRQAEAFVNEQFGVYSRKAVVREQLAAYDAALEEAYKCMKEGKPLADKDYDKDGKIESPKDEVWGSRLRAAKMAGKLKEEEQIDEISQQLAGRYRSIAKTDLVHRTNKALHDYQDDKPVDKKNRKKTLNRLSGIRRADKHFKEETQIDEGISHDARELATYADNHAQLHRSSHQPIVKNLQRKHEKGAYDHGKAEKLWGYHAKRAADAYHKEFGHKFSVAHRKEAAKHMADSARDEHGFGSVKEDITVAKGDTMTSLAAKNGYGKDVAGFAKSVGFKGNMNKIQAGQTFKSSAPSTAAAPTKWANPGAKDYSTSNAGVDKPTPAASTTSVKPLPSMAQSSSVANKTSAGTGVGTQTTSSSGDKVDYAGADRAAGQAKMDTMNSLSSTKAPVPVPNKKNQEAGSSMQNVAESLNECVKIGNRVYKII